MTMTDGPRCAVRHDDLRCENVTTGALPICGSCLTELLEEADPRRRRALAVVEQLPAGVVQRLVDDPDPQVRAQVATRGDLDAGTIARLADPDREPAPEVWRALATTPAGAEHAWELCSTNDPLTLAIVASNPAVGAEVLERLVDNPDPDVAHAAAAARAGRPPDARIAAEIADARVTEARPITQAPGEKPTPVEDAPPPELGEDATATAEPDRRRIVTRLIVGAIALVVIGAVIALAIGLSRGSSDQGLTASGGRVTTTAAATTTAPTTSTTTSTTTTSTTVAPTTAPPTAPPSTNAPPPTPGQIVPPATGAQEISQKFTISSGSQPFCTSVNVTVVFSPSPAHVVVTDDAGRTIGNWTGPSGQTKKLSLWGPTKALNVTVSEVATGINATGNATGSACSS